MRRYLYALPLLAFSGPVCAAPPPPPPPFVFDAATILSDPTSKEGAIEPLFADDVVASENGSVIATGKKAWLQWRKSERSKYYGRTIGYTYSSGLRDPSEKRSGELLVVDTFDTIDINNQPRGVVMDSRMSTRSTLYVFGSDKLIHMIQMSKVAGFWNTSTKGVSNSPQ